MARNVEIKALLKGEAGNILAAICRVADSSAPLILYQVDTYFRANTGQRFKLRVENGNAQLIAYARADTANPKLSNYQIVGVEDADAILNLLAIALGVIAKVRKTRRVFFKDNVRIHLDQVEGLKEKSFLEIEVVLGENESEESGKAKAHELMAALGIPASDLVDHGYLDMLVESGANCPGAGHE
jgi:predicted adenylyl cyclase CyaB